MLTVRLVSLFFIGFVAFDPAVANESSETVTRIAFGSCNRHDLPQPLWTKISDKNPQVFMWTGDVVYPDVSSDKKYAEAYKKQLEQPDYKKFLSTKGLEVIGTWDDNDYGSNNGGKGFKHKERSQRVFLDFLSVDPDSPRRAQKGIYTSHTYGPEGKRVKVLLLDDRYHRQEVKKDRSGDILGQAQWKWLETELKKSSAQVHIIVSGIQIIPMDHKYENWNLHTESRSRLLELLKRYKPAKTILISGDRHIAEISMIPKKDSGIGYDLYELTSSGLTHSYEKHSGEPNRYRVGELFKYLNFGMIEINWSGKEPQVTGTVFDKNGQSVLEMKL